MRWSRQACFLMGVMALQAGLTGQAASAAKASEQAFVMEHLHTEVEFQSDGTGWQDTQATIQVQNSAGVQALAIVSFPFTQGEQSVEVSYVRVRQPNGTLIATPAENIRDMPAPVSQAAPMYSDLMMKQVVVKGLDIGDTLEYEVRIRQVKALVAGQFWFSYAFSRAVVCSDEQLTIHLPAARAVTVESPGYTASVSEAEGVRTYHWQTSNDTVEKVADPTVLPPPPSVQLTTFSNWATVGAWYDGLQKTQLVVTPAVRAKATELLQGVTGDDARIAALYTFVSERIHYVSLSFGIGRYQPHSADDVLSNGYGDCKDKHTLLAALLQAAGYTAWPALVNTAQAVDAKLSSPGQFDHVVTVVQRGDGWEWLDATVGTAPAEWMQPLLRGSMALLVRGGGATQLVPVPEAAAPATEDFDLTGALSGDATLTAKVSFTFTGDNAVLMRTAFQATPPANWGQLMQSVVAAVGFAGTVSNVTVNALPDLEKPLVVTYDYKREKYGSWDTQQITPPLPLLLLPRWSDPGQATVLGLDARIETARARVTFPDGYGVTPPRDVHVHTDALSYDARYSYAGGAYSAERVLHIFTKTVPEADKQAYLDLVKGVSDDVNAWTTFTPPASALSPVQQSNQLTAAGWALYQTGSYSAAAAKLQQAVQLNPQNNTAWNDLGLAKQYQLDLAGAVAAFQHAIAANASDPYAYNNLGRILVAEGKRDEAEAKFRKAIALNADDHYAHASLGELLTQEQKHPEAIAELKIAARVADTAAVEYALGQSELATHEPAAIEAMEKAVQMNPSPLMENNVAYDLSDAGINTPQVRTMAQAAIAGFETGLAGAQLPPTPSQAFELELLAKSWDTLGWILYQQGDATAAEPYLAAAWSLDEDAVEGDHLAQAYEKMGRRQDAERVYAEVGGPPASSHAAVRLRALAGSTEAADALVDQDEEDTVNRRTLAVPPVAEGHMTATVWLTLAADGKLTGVKAVSGDPLPHDLAQRWAGVKFPLVLPPGSKVHVFRLGNLHCASTAQCVLVLVPAGRAVTNP